MIGLGKATVTFRVQCTCDDCGTHAPSSQSNVIDTGTIAISDLGSMIVVLMEAAFVQPPVGWAVYGRYSYKCDKCLT
jgi:hypothetical protein